MCGSSSEQQAAYQADTTLSNTIMSDMNLNFAENAQILDSLKGASEPIVAAGPYQFGYNPAETQALRSQASDLTTKGAQDAEIASGAKMATAGGGTSLLPSGAEAAIGAGINANAAFQNSQQQQQITEAGYEQGNKNFNTAETVLAEAPGALENPITGMANAAVGANNSTSSEANAITAANQAWMAPLAGLVGSLGSAKIKA